MKSLRRAIRDNQRFCKYEKLLRRIRLRIFEYEDDGQVGKGPEGHRTNQGDLRTHVGEAGKAIGKQDAGAT